jgi:tetratricopeptide (TPR) repeat protein
MIPRVAQRAGVLAAVIALTTSLYGSEYDTRADRLDLTALLNDYAAGRFDEVVRTLSNASDDAARDLMPDWPTVGRHWIDVTPEGRHRRLLVAASLAIEFENIRIERGDWQNPRFDFCQLLVRLGSPARGTTPQCFINWTYSLLLERGYPDDAERAWVIATAALVEGVHDARFLHVPAGAPEGFVLPIKNDRIVTEVPGRGARPTLRGLVDRALERFPDDPLLKFHRALAVASRFNITIEGQRLTSPGPAAAGTNEDPVGLLSELRSDPRIGAEARLRLGYVLWAAGKDEESRTELEAAVTATSDPDLRYLARFLLGSTAMTRDDFEEAKRQFALALETRPNSQSAALALATLHLKDGEAARAYDLAEASFAKRPHDNDPWRLFLDGHHPHLPVLLADLRSKTR